MLEKGRPVMKTNDTEVVAWEVRVCSEPETEVGVSSKYPEWAERDENLNIMPLVRLSDYEALQAECERLRKGLDAVQDIIDSSYGVAGLHLNGDIAPWSDLREGGRFMEWLSEFDAAMQEPNHDNQQTR